MTERIAEIVVLVEDDRQGNFVRHYLKRDGHSYRNIRLEISPRGRGSGEQYVREHYPIEMKYYRSRSHNRKAALVAAIDADVGTVADRERQLEGVLKAAGETQRQKSEQVALLIPKRNIETWILFLAGETVDENEDKHDTKDVDSKVRNAANVFYDWSRAAYPVPQGCIQSLRHGLQEIRRID